MSQAPATPVTPDQLVWECIHTYFRDNPQALVNHHVESYNDFFDHGLSQMFREKNPLKWTSQYDDTLEDYRTQCHMYMGGRDGSKIYFGKPVVYDHDTPHFMFPNEARLRNMTYAMTVHYDIEVEFVTILPLTTPETLATEADPTKLVGGVGYDDTDTDDEDPDAGPLSRVIPIDGGADPAPKRPKKTKALTGPLTPNEGKALREYAEQTVTRDPTTGRVIQRQTLTLERVYLGKFPIMVQSNQCVLYGAPREARYTMGECRNDPGGYFIIDGKEKVVVPQEKFGDNMMYIRKGEPEAEYLYSCEIKSVSENVTKPVRTLSLRMMAPTKSYTNGQIVVNIPNVRAPVPLFILFRALGILSDRDILATILLDLDKYPGLLDLFIPSIHDGGVIYTQRNAIEYIAYLTKGKAFHHGLEILADYFLPHIGEVNFREKALFLGYMVFRMVSVHSGFELPTDRDNFKYKRLELPGTLIGELFRDYYSVQLKRIHLDFERQLKMNSGLYERDLPRLIQDHYQSVFREGGKIVEDGFKKAFKGNWGAFSHTKRIGVIQDLNRLSFNTMISHLRKTNLPIDASLKIVGPRLCHNSQWGFIDPLDTPDGGNIGIHKHLAIATTVSRGYSRDLLVEWLREMVGMRLVTDFIPQELATTTKVMVNGYWAGCVTDPLPTVEKIRTYRRLAMLPVHTSVTFDFKLNTVFLATDAGRLCRPIFYTDPQTQTVSLLRPPVLQQHRKWTWEGLTRGMGPKKPAADAAPHPWDALYRRVSELYDVPPTTETDPEQLDKLLATQAVIDYIDSGETEHTMIAINLDAYQQERKTRTKTATPEARPPTYTHCEIHNSLMFGVMTNQIPFPETNPPARNLFSCGQSKQACSLYHTNYQMRMDKTAVVLHYGQIPLVKQRYGEYISHEENPYGFNAIVAIACYTGYNVEDAILINAGALARGMFRTTYYTSYSAHEERGDPATSGTEIPVDHRFTNIESVADNVTGLRPGYDYSQLDRHGLIRESTPVTDKTILIGLTATGGTVMTRDQRTDASTKPKRGQLGYVDKTYMTEGEEGDRVAKVRIREERIPTLGDKFASRVGQKGTIGMVIPERDMPFTKDGIRPDLIINPHAIPSRMTIGQLVETLTGKVCATKAVFADSTAFGQPGSQTPLYGKILQDSLQDDPAYESYGNEILYNGMTGEQIETSIFIGPVYYMRLKHMVKDKQQSRCLGPRSALTKQPVGGRANEGGLRIGEMERDSILAHGATCFLNESMMERGDKYYMAVCNQSGMLAIYNPTKNLFMSPMAEGPLKFLDQDLATTSATDPGLRVETVTRFGRDFSVVEIPYALKLLIQELQTINIQLRIITEDNIDQLENLSYKTIRDSAQEYLRRLELLSREATKDQDRELSDRIRDAMESSTSIESEWVVKADPESPRPGQFSPESTPHPEEGYPEGYFDTPPGSPTRTHGGPRTPSASPPQKGGATPDSPETDPDLRKDLEPWDDDQYDYSHLTGATPSRPRPSAPGPGEWKIITDLPPERGAPSPTMGVPVAVSLPGSVFQEKSFVHLAGDNKPTRLWMIEDIKETPHTTLYTLITNDNEGLRPGDRIQVVKHGRLVPVHPEMYPSAAGGAGLVPPGSAELSGPTSTPQIVFSPIMINGTGNSAGTGTPQPDPYGQDYLNPQMPGSLPPLPLSAMSRGPRGNPATPQAMAEAAPAPAAPKDQEGGGKGWVQAAIDMTKNFLVKKTG